MANATENTVNKKHTERSSPYPSSNLETAIEDVATLRERLGKGPYSREEAAQALGYKGVNGISASRIASCGYFGLLSRSGSTYSMSELAERILNYTSNEEKNKAIVEACETPALYNKLLQSYAEQALPQMLENILSRNYGISSKAAETAARVFRESATFAGRLENGVIRTDSILMNSETESAADVTQEESPSKNKQSPQDKPKALTPRDTGSKSFEKERGVFESGDGWELSASCKYSSVLPRDVRKKINQFLEMADDIIDMLSELDLKSNEEANEDE